MPSGHPIATADDQGLVRGDGCFDAMRILAVDGAAVVENLDAHLARFAASARTLELSLDEATWRELIAQAAAAWTMPPPEAVLKLVLTRGPESTPGQVTGFLTVTELDLDVMREARAGISVRTLNRGYRSDGFAAAPWLLGGTKLVSYAVNSAAKRAAARQGDDDALFVSTDGFALEGPTAAALMLRNGVLSSPLPGPSGILDSVTVRQIFAEAGAFGVGCEYRPIPVDELFTADVVWLASSIRGVCPIRRLDGRNLTVDEAWAARVAAWGGF